MLAIGLTLAALLSGVFPCRAAAPQMKHALVLHSYHKGLTWTDSVARGIEAEFKRSPMPVEIFHEFMDTKRIFTQAYLRQLVELYRTKYSGQHFDLVICSDDHAFNFLRIHHQALFGDVPVVFCGVNDYNPAMLEGLPKFTGTVESIDMVTTLNTALRLHPQATHLVAIVDETMTGKANKKLFRQALTHLDRPMQVTYLENQTMQELLDAVGHLNPSDIAVWLAFTMDRSGKMFTFRESANLISSHSTAPLYSFWDFLLGQGIVGGMLTSGYSQGQTAATMALRILQGSPVADVPVITKSPNRFMFDYVQLDRFGIDLARLPAGSIVINRPSGLYARHKQTFWAIIGGFAALSAIIVLLVMNILRRRRSEAALKLAHDRYQNIFDSSAVALFEEDCSAIKQAVDAVLAEGVTDMTAYLEANPQFVLRTASLLRINDANAAALRLYDAQAKREMLGSLEKFLTPQALEVFKEILIAIAQGRSRFTGEVVSRTLTGQILHILLTFALPSNLHGFDRIIVSAVDISERKQAEDALRRSENRFRTIFDHAASGMALIDQQGNYLRANAALCRMLGYSESELQQKNWRDVSHPDDIELTKKVINNLLDSGKAPPMEKRYFNKQGETVWGLLNVALIADQDNDPRYYIVQVQDITLIKAAQARLRQREERYRQIFEADLSGFYIVTTAGELLMCNRVFAEILGFSSVKDAVGADFNAFYKDPTLRPKLLSDLSRKKKLEHCEAEFVRRDGATIHVLINAVGQFDAKGQLVEICGYLMDVTRQKSLEAQLLHAQKMESIGTMAGGVAHDFNNLLMGIMGNASLAMIDLGEQHPTFSRLKNIEQYVHSGSDLTSQLLGFAKGGKYEVRTTDPNLLLKRNLKMFARTHKNIAVHTALSENIWPIEADRTQIDQVLYNLYVNAQQAMEKGGDLYIATRNKMLDAQQTGPHGLAPGRYVEISVADTGAGMRPEILPRIFDPFFTTKERGRGTGLGLASAYGIIKNHSGFITVTSRKEDGSTFYIYLPASNRKLEEKAPAPNSQVAGGSESILLVDDETIVLDAVGNMLRHLGYNVKTANSGAQAVETYRAHKQEIDLVILDMVMPGMGGSDTFNQLREINPEVRVILCSGYSADGHAAEILERRCQGFMQKPFTLSKLSQKLHEVFQLQQ